MVIVYIILAVVFGAAFVFGQLGHFVGPGHFMIRWLITGPIERPKLSPPMPITGPNTRGQQEEVGIQIQNMPYEGRLKRWIRRKAEDVVAITFEVVGESGATIFSGQGRWTNEGSYDWTVSIPPTGPYESGIRQMYLFQKHEGEEKANARGGRIEGNPEIALGDYQIKLNVYDSEERATYYVADMFVTKRLEGFKIENIRPRTE